MILKVKARCLMKRLYERGSPQTKLRLVDVDLYGVVLEASEVLLEMLAVAIIVFAGDEYVVDVGEVERKTWKTSKNLVDDPWKVWAEFFSPNCIRMYSKMPKGVMVSVSGMSAVFTGV